MLLVLVDYLIVLLHTPLVFVSQFLHVLGANIFLGDYLLSLFLHDLLQLLCYLLFLLRKLTQPGLFISDFLRKRFLLLNQLFCLGLDLLQSALLKGVCVLLDLVEGLLFEAEFQEGDRLLLEIGDFLRRHYNIYYFLFINSL